MMMLWVSMEKICVYNSNGSKLIELMQQLNLML